MQVAVKTRRTYSSDRQLARRRKIVDTTVDMIRECGIDGVSMRAIADRSGVSAATLYNIYGTRDGLLFEATTGWAEPHFRSIIASIDFADPLETLIKFTDQLAEIVKADPTLPAITIQLYYTKRFSEWPRNLFGVTTVIVEPILVRLRNEGLIHKYFPIEFIGRDLTSRHYDCAARWLNGELPIDGFASALRLETLLVLAAIGTQTLRQDAMSMMQDLLSID